MRVPFTKMQGLGNDFVVLDETRARLPLQAAHYRFLADRHFGVGADQILTVRPSPASGIDFEYVIHNADGDAVEQCGNGARCLARFVREHGLSLKNEIRVQTQNRVLALRLEPDGQVTVDMGAPQFALAEIGFDATHLSASAATANQASAPHPQDWQLWPLSLGETLKASRTEGLDSQNRPLRNPFMPDLQPTIPNPDSRADSALVLLALVSMGNPHAVQVVADVDTAPVQRMGAQIESHPRFLHRVNAGFMQVVDRSHIRLRVFERGVGETLACGSGACAAVVAGARLGLLDPVVQVQTRGGVLTIAWPGGDQPVLLTGPATTVFHGSIDLPKNL